MKKVLFLSIIISFFSLALYLPAQQDKTGNIYNDAVSKEISSTDNSLLKPNRDYNIAPVPNYRPDPKNRNFDNYEVVFEKNQNAYLQNAMFPSSIASIRNIGAVRHLLMCNLVIYPFQYNPAAKEIIQYSRIHIRI